jgi:hypothetical protein
LFYERPLFWFRCRDISAAVFYHTDSIQCAESNGFRARGHACGEALLAFVFSKDASRKISDLTPW